MRRCLQTVLGGFLVCGLNLGSPAARSDSVPAGSSPGNAGVGERAGNPGLERYQTIPQRNIFGLQAPPAKPEVKPEPTPMPNVLLTGITTILGNKRAVLKLVPAGGKPGTPATEESYILTEGQREGPIEVRHIDEQAGRVQAVVAGTPVTLDFERNGPRLPTGSAPGAAVPAPTGAIPPPGGVASTYSRTSVLGTMPTNAANLQTRTFRIPSRPAAVPTNAYPAGAVAAGALPALPPVTNYTLPPVTNYAGALPLPTAPAHAVQEQPLTAEEQAILAEVQRALNNSAAPVDPGQVRDSAVGAPPPAPVTVPILPSAPTPPTR